MNRHLYWIITAVPTILCVLFLTQWIKESRHHTETKAELAYIQFEASSVEIRLDECRRVVGELRNGRID